MPFKTFNAGSVFTAADANAYFMNQAVATFTNEAARDAAITSPSEGMIAYLTAPTVPAATGNNTQVPTGVKTIYNGTVWVCVTPVGAREPSGGTTTSTSYTTTLGAGTNPTVTLVTGTSALVSIGALIYNSGANETSMSVSVSGAATVAALDDYKIANGFTTGIAIGRTFVMSGLTAGTNTFALSHKAAAGTGNYIYRTLGVQGIA